MEEIVNILKWTVLFNGFALILTMVHAFLNSKRTKRLEKTLAELTVLVLANPQTDAKLVKQFIAETNHHR